MKKYPFLVQCDKRGQIVIPKEIRSALGIDESTGFWVYAISEEGIFLQATKPKPLSDNPDIKTLKEKSSKISAKSKNIEKAEEEYHKESGKWEDV